MKSNQTCLLFYIEMCWMAQPTHKEAYFNEINTENTVFYQESDIDCMSCILYLHVQELSITHFVYQGAN